MRQALCWLLIAVVVCGRILILLLRQCERTNAAVDAVDAIQHGLGYAGRMYKFTPGGRHLLEVLLWDVGLETSLYRLVL
jgi:hypothetical protein